MRLRSVGPGPGMEYMARWTGLGLLRVYDSPSVPPFFPILSGALGFGIV